MNVKDFTAFGKTLWKILGWFGWQAPVSAFALAAAGAIWAILQNTPSSIIVMATFCVFVAAIVLFKVPSFYKLLAGHSPNPHPDPNTWRHHERYTLAQAACLLADIIPVRSEKIPSGNADGWYHALKQVIESGVVQRARTPSDDEYHLIRGVYYVHPGTWISRESLKAFAERTNARCEFLRD